MHIRARMGGGRVASRVMNNFSKSHYRPAHSAALSAKKPAILARKVALSAQAAQ